jgi:hypothetical protein
MMRNAAIVLGAAVLLLWAASFAMAQTSSQLPSTTLYSPNKYKTEQKVSCLNLQSGPSQRRYAHCDLRYGNLWAGDELDWFQSATGEGDRTVIKDLGSYEWTAQFEIPAVEPFPKLKPGEQRSITLDTSGADGEEGKPGENGMNGDGTVTTSKPAPPPGPKRDGKPKIDPVFVKAVAGHMYVIHVVDETRDFYALFRVESVERGDNCTISWKPIPAPATPTAIN